MAVFSMTDAVVTVNGVDLSDHVQSVQLNYDAADLDTTAMGSSTRTRIAGLKDWSMSVTFYQDYAASKVDATLFPLIGAAAFTVTAKATSGATSSTNPLFTGSAILGSYSGPAGGRVGEVAMATAEFRCAGTLTRATS